MQENNPKDSAPGDKGRGGHVSIEESISQPREGHGPGHLLGFLQDGSSKTKLCDTTIQRDMAGAAALVPIIPAGNKTSLHQHKQP